MVNITDDELWHPEPALRPEDELILRKLHEMLQTTADDLKLLSGEISKFHEPGVQFKTAPTPLDEEFNEKVHIEEIVNAKFHGYRIIEKQNVPETKPRNDANEIKASSQRPKVMNTGAQEKATTVKRPINRNLGISRTRIIQINENKDKSSNEKLNNGEVYKAPKATVAYNEFCYEHIEPEVKETPRKLQFQHMPRINIRSELREQKVLQLDIAPDIDVVKEINTAKSNVSVIAMQHKNFMHKVPCQPDPVENPPAISNKTCRRVSKMSTCDSSGSANNISSDAQVKLSTQKRIISSIRNSPLTSARNRYKKNSANKSEHEKRPVTNLDDWKKKLNIVYGSSSSKKTKTSPSKVSAGKSSPKKSNASKTLNNAKYIPYSQLTLGGVRVSDVEKEISHIPNKSSIPLSPILDKIISSRENSFRKDNAKKREKDSPRILTTSDENLLQEVIDIERSVSQTLSKKNIKTAKDATEPVTRPPSFSNSFSEDSANDKNSDSYADDFEDDKSDHSTNPGKPKPSNRSSDNNNSAKSESSNSDGGSDDENAEHDPIPGPSKPNTTYTKLNLSLRNSVEVFEFVHSVDVQDTATQSNAINKITPKETQTSPRNDRSIAQPTIHNDLWSLDPRREVEKMFEMEKDFIKKLIIDEYGDLLEKNINKPSTSNEKVEDCRKNVSAMQKNTQTSPARVKNVMTSPKLTKSRMTSPFHLSVPVHQQTSPIVVSPVVVTEEQQNIDVTNEDDDISVILSSPRFSLRLPQNSREVFSNLEAHSRNASKNTAKKVPNKILRETASSSSLDADNSSSELSSLGEVRMKKFRKRVPSISECSSSSKYSSDFQSMGILPLRSEGELSLGQGHVARVRAKKTRNSEGETSLDPLL